MRHLLLIRHGESKWNEERRIQGQDGPGLTELGRRQARCTATWIAQAAPDATVVTSDLVRCRESAAPIAEALAVSPRPEPDLRERDFGEWTGALVSEIAERDAERFARWRDGDDVVAEVGGESAEQLERRVLAVLERLVAGLPEGGVAVVVTHGGPVWHGSHRFLGLSSDALGGVANASTTELVADERWGRRLGVFNQTAHLPPELRPRRRIGPGRSGEDDGG